MIDHTGINVSSLARSKAFYAAALAPLGYRLGKDYPTACGFGVEGSHVGGFWLIEGTPQTPRHHIAFSAASRDLVDAFHKAAIAAGGRDNGAPGLRPHYHGNYYGAFVLDPDGFNIEAVCHGP